MKKCIELHTRTNDFSNGVPLSIEELEQYRIKVAESLANNPDGSYTSTRTGNMLTIAVRDEDKIRVFQVEGYIQYTFRVEEESVKVM